MFCAIATMSPLVGSRETSAVETLSGLSSRGWVSLTDSSATRWASTSSVVVMVSPPSCRVLSRSSGVSPNAESWRMEFST